MDQLDPSAGRPDCTARLRLSRSSLVAQVNFAKVIHRCNDAANELAGARRKRLRLYGSLCAVKIILAALRSTAGAS